MSGLRHVTSINDLDNAEIEQVFALADKYLKELGETMERTERTRAGANLTTQRIAKSGRMGTGSILATLFYEPSTRTRLSFESAMLRLGGRTITSADPATSSAAKGESLADTVRVVSSYADAIVIRHPRDGAAKLAAQYASIPVINGGDGAHEHPTQTLCDLFTLRRHNKKLKNLSVAVSGDLRGSRTIHSFVYALARFGAAIRLMPGGKGMELPAHVDWRLRNEFKCVPLPKAKYAEDDAVDALYVTAERPHQLSLIADASSNYKLKKAVDAVYVTRFQKERWSEGARDYMKVDSKFLQNSRYKNTSVMHPLPRVGELDIALDHDTRAAYFQQAAYGVPIRMALIAEVLGLEKNFALAQFKTGFRHGDYELYERPPGDSGIRCRNPNCIVHDPYEGPYAANKFLYVPAEAPRLRCYYCETDIVDFLIAHRRRGHYDSKLSRRRPVGDFRDVVFFADEEAAETAGFSKGQPRRAAGK
jgi:aspartate carbamoyltransferase catalytic subunit